MEYFIDCASRASRISDNGLINNKYWPATALNCAFVILPLYRYVVFANGKWLPVVAVFLACLARNTMMPLSISFFLSSFFFFLHWRSRKNRGSLNNLPKYHQQTFYFPSLISTSRSLSSKRHKRKLAHHGCWENREWAARVSNKLIGLKEDRKKEKKE